MEAGFLFLCVCVDFFGQGQSFACVNAITMPSIVFVMLKLTTAIHSYSVQRGEKGRGVLRHSVLATDECTLA